MSDRPMLFSGPMICGMLDGRKTQTRRVLNPPEGYELVGIYGPGLTAVFSRDDGFYKDWKQKLPLLGDRVWCRETFRQAYPATAYSAGIVYRADKSRSLGMDEYSDRHRWKPSIFMPRWASRLTLIVTDVRVQRLQDITRGDAMDEGCPFPNMADGANPCDWFKDLWNSINAKRGYGWDANPWVAAYTFTVHKCNIDQPD